MNDDILLFFARTPEAMTLYCSFEEKLRARLGEVKIKVSKTQISFSNRYNFAFVSLPIRRVKGRPDIYIIVSFGLSYQLDNPRIAESVEPYPRRWTHHVIVSSLDDIDDELMSWINEAYAFSMVK